MGNPAADEARALSDRELAEAINEAYRELFNLRIQKGTHQLQDAGAVGRSRRQVARLRTVMRERQLAEDAGAPLAPLTETPEPEISPQKQRALEERAAQADEEAEMDVVDEVDAPDADTDEKAE